MDMFKGIQFAKMRSFDDFLLGKDKYKIPEGLVKANKRVAQNLLYYQTNYFQVILTMLVFIGYCSPSKFFIGLLSTSVSVAGLIYGVNKRNEIRALQTDHPCIFLLSILSLSCFLVYLFGASTVFLLSITLPLIVVFTHASLRTRNIVNSIEKNVEKTMEKMGARKTPMGILLFSLDLLSDKIFD